MTKSSKEYVAAHRARKAATAFTEKFLRGSEIATLPGFIEAKEAEFCDKYTVASVQLDAGLLNAFYDVLEDYQSEKDTYTVDNLLEAWSRANQSVKAAA